MLELTIPITENKDNYNEFRNDIELAILSMMLAKEELCKISIRMGWTINPVSLISSSFHYFHGYPAARGGHLKIDNVLTSN